MLSAVVQAVEVQAQVPEAVVHRAAEVALPKVAAAVALDQVVLRLSHLRVLNQVVPVLFLLSLICGQHR